MAEMTSQDMAGKLLAVRFEHSGPSTTALSDPIADTPIVVTLDQLRPYDHDPRKKRNPVYEEIKASIRERGLDAAPAITRRPGHAHYIIRNGGNTRLAILRELWAETRDERFFRIVCLFRPWPARGEIIALTGHLAENELRGGLTFIEHALGVEKAREFYEQESGNALSQSELTRRLAADGYPVQQSHISRMADAVRYLLPVIPTVLYGGLGRHQVERLSVMRKDVDPGLDTPDRLRIHIAQFAREIASEANLDECIEDRPDGIGLACRAPAQASSPLARAVLALLVSLAGQQSAEGGLDCGQLATDLPTLLHGQGDAARRLSDTALVKLFRLLRPARRLLDLEAGAAASGT